MLTIFSNTCLHYKSHVKYLIFITFLTKLYSRAELNQIFKIVSLYLKVKFMLKNIFYEILDIFFLL